MTLLKLYGWISPLLEPVAHIWLWYRLRSDKEDAERVTERHGLASISRPVGSLAWLHGASVGECNSILPLVDRLQAEGLSVLVTSGTITSATEMQNRLPTGAIHQFIPIDVPRWVDRFLQYWRPDVAVWIESELWPSLIMRTHFHAIPQILVNARMSPTSYKRWKYARSMVAYLLDRFDRIFAQSTTDARRMAALLPPGSEAPVVANIKLSAGPLPVDQIRLNTLRQQANGRSIWVAGSIHPGEETAVLNAHMTLQSKRQKPLTVVIPRHPGKSLKLSRAFTAAGLNVVFQSKTRDITHGTDVYFVDAIGSLGVWYALAGIVFIGGSLIPHGGQNPLEPARLGCHVVTGPHMANFRWLDDIWPVGHGRSIVDDGAQLGKHLMAFFTDYHKRTAVSSDGPDLNAYGADILDIVADAVTTCANKP